MSEEPTPRVLVVNDDAGSRYLISRVLRAAGCAVDEASTGYEGLSKAEQTLPDVIVLDIKLPDLVGYDVCKRLKDSEVTSRIAIIQTSATFVTPQGRARGLDSGADAYLSQPFEAIELVAMVRSLLRLKRTEAEARQKAALLVEADRRKDEFLAMLGHELRNPLSAIVAASSLIQKGDLPMAEVQRFNSTIHRQAGNLARLVDDLLDVSRITQGKISLALRRVDLREVVNAVHRAHRGEADRRHHRLVVDVGEKPLWVQGDATRLEQIVGNLLGNAMKYTSNGGHIQVTVAERVAPTGNVAVFHMRDTGIGLATEDLASIWDLFVQVDTSLVRATSGLGIGLTMVRRLVEMHGGKVHVHSDGPGKGSDFSFEIPVLDLADAPPESATTHAPARSLRLLLVDDNGDSCELYKFAFEQNGHHVTCANDGQEGVEEALENTFDFAIIDIGLPTMDGYQVAAKLRAELGAKCPYLIALTGYGRPEDRQRALAAGFDLHLVKPIDVAVLETMFSRLRRSARTAV